MPHPSTVRDWINDGSKQMFSRAIAHAREIGFDVIATDCLSIADNAQNDWMDNNDPDNPGFKFNGEHVQRSKLRIETRLKLLAKWDPKRYGEMMRQEISGPDGGEIPMPSKSDAEMAAFAEKLAKAQSKLK